MNIFKIALLLLISKISFADPKLLKESELDVRSGKHFSALKKLFSVQKSDPRLAPEATNSIMNILVRNQMWNLASYFYLKALKSENDRMIEAVTPFTAQLVANIGLDMLQGLMLKNTKSNNYKGINKDYFLYVGGKFLFGKGEYQKVASYLELIDRTSPVYPFARYVMGSSKLILGQINPGINDFIECRETAVGTGNQFASRNELKDLSNRCRIGIARAYYQVEDYEKSFQFYDEVDQTSFIWTESLFEAAWAAYSVGDYNRALGKLVTYKAPILRFVYNPEIELLRAQSYLKLCLYEDVSLAVKEFKTMHVKSGKEIRDYLKSRNNKYRVLFREALDTLAKPRDQGNDVERAVNNFIREPYFMGIVNSHRYIDEEVKILNQISGGQIESGLGRTFRSIIEWRKTKNEEIGGRFVQKSLYTTYKRLLSFLDQVTFIKLDMLSNERMKLMKEEKPLEMDRARGSLGPPSRKNHQFIWIFNGEFWMDELGDYVFALKSECEKEQEKK